MGSVKRAWHRTPRTIRQTLVLMVGGAVVLAGLAMLVLPGPGWAAIFLGFAILATEFAFAERVRDWLVGVLKQATSAGKRAWRRLMRRRS